MRGFRLRARAAAPVLLLAGACCLGSGCGRRASTPAPPPSPVGAARYQEILRDQAGIDLSPAALATAATADQAWIERRLDRLAGRIAPGTPWRALFERLRADHPETAAGVLALYRRETDRARRFVAAHRLMDVPDGPLEIVDTATLPVPGRYPLTAYLGYRLAVATHGPDGAPRLADHCAVCVPPLAVHETYPGHHAAFLRQRAFDPTGVDPATLALSSAQIKDRFFHEGWAQYAEIAMLEAGYYDGSPERELGAWRNLLLRVVRARIDPLLHTGAVTPEEAARLLARELLLSPGLARAEVHRHLEDPGLKAAYYVGLVQVLALRRAVEDAATADHPFDLRAFHDRFVELPMAIPEVARRRFGVEIGPWPVGGLAEVLPAGMIDGP